MIVSGPIRVSKSVGCPLPKQLTNFVPFDVLREGFNRVAAAACCTP